MENEKQINFYKYKKQCKITSLSFLVSSLLLFLRYFLIDDGLLNVVLILLGVAIFIGAIISAIYTKKFEREYKKN